MYFACKYLGNCRLILSLTYILAVIVDFNAGRAQSMRGIYFDLNRYRVQPAVEPALCNVNDTFIKEDQSFVESSN